MKIHLLNFLKKYNLQMFEFVVFVLFAVLIVYSVFENIKNEKEKELLSNQITEVRESLENLEGSLLVISDANLNLSQALEQARDLANTATNQIKKINSTVGDLEKLATMDAELLQKYSKVYFLNEHYSPPSLSKIKTDYTINGKEVEIHSKVRKFLYDLLKEAEEDGLSIKVLSGFRSFETQKNLKNNYTVTYGAGTANTFSADQGYSEHQLGTAVDFTTPELVTTSTNFDKTPEFAWLQKNAHNFGFIMSYPKNNSYYIYEPWHWRFVGRDLASDLYDQDKKFYDMSQREIDKYLSKFFD